MWAAHSRGKCVGGGVVEWERCGLGFIGFSCALVSSVPFYTHIARRMVKKKGHINGEKGFNSLIFVGWRVSFTAHDMGDVEMRLERVFFR